MNETFVVVKNESFVLKDLLLIIYAIRIFVYVSLDSNNITLVWIHF